MKKPIPFQILPSFMILMVSPRSIVAQGCMHGIWQIAWVAASFSL